MKKAIFLFTILVFTSFVTAGFGYNDLDGPILSPEQTIFNNNTAFVNLSADSILWQGYTPATLPHNLLDNLAWSVAGHTIDENIDMNDHTFTELENVIINDGSYLGSWGTNLKIANPLIPIGALDLGTTTYPWEDLYLSGNVYGRGTGSWFNQTLLISGDHPVSTNSDATLVIQSEVNYISCINLTEGGNLGFQICYDGTGGGELVIKNMNGATEYMTIDRDTGGMVFHNETTFVNVTTTNITTTIISTSGISGRTLGQLDTRGSPWILTGVDLQIAENLIVDNNITGVDWLNATTLTVGNANISNLIDEDGNAYIKNNMDGHYNISIDTTYDVKANSFDALDNSNVLSVDGTTIIKKESLSLAFGDNAGSSVNTASLMLGSIAGYDSSGEWNTYAGTSAGRSSIGNYNLFFGGSAGRSSTGNTNIFIGDEVGMSSTLNNSIGIGTTPEKNGQAIIGGSSITEIKLNATTIVDGNITANNFLGNWNGSINYYLNTNPFGFYNSTDFSISDYFTKTETNTTIDDRSLNETEADLLYLKKSVGGRFTGYFEDVDGTTFYTEEFVS